MKPKKTDPAPIIDIDVTQIRNVSPQEYIVDLVVDNTPWRLPLLTFDLECLMSSLSILASTNYPRVGGWNIYSKADGKLLKSVSTVDFIAKITQLTPLKLDPSNKSATAKGFVPVVTPTSEAFAQMLEKSKKEGRIPR